MTIWSTIEQTIGCTPLVLLEKIPGMDNKNRKNIFLGKLEGNNPAGSVKDRAALSMIKNAEIRGNIKVGQTLLEATSGNTGIALAMVAAMRGYKIKLIMPDNLSIERRSAMTAYGAELILTPHEKGGMEYARDLAKKMEYQGEGKVLDQFSNFDNPLAHIEGTGPEIWEQTSGEITHFVSAMGTTGTIMGVSTYLKNKNPKIQIIGVQPKDGSQIPGIRKWSLSYLPKIYDQRKIDRIILVNQFEAEEMARRLATEEGIFCGVSAASAFLASLKISQETTNSKIVFIVCDRGDRYISTGLF